ncbi:MAG: hypothetical protein M5U01_02270 [Ardenticatenaceae bacterium]|nr:hypothetical protein [Ardenticatenaceae bacterium]
MNERNPLADQIGALVVQVYAIHKTVIAETGGLEGLRESES